MSAELEGLREVRVEKFILITSTRGDGSAGCPLRLITTVYDLDGGILFESEDSMASCPHCGKGINE